MPRKNHLTLTLAGPIHEPPDAMLDTLSSLSESLVKLDASSGTSLTIPFVCIEDRNKNTQDTFHEVIYFGIQPLLNIDLRTIRKNLIGTIDRYATI